MAIEITRRGLLGWIGGVVVASALPRVAVATQSPWMPFIPGLRRTYTLAQVMVSEEDDDGASPKAPLLREPLRGDTVVERILSVEPVGDGLVAEVETAGSAGAFVHHQRWRPGGVLADAGPLSSAVGPVTTVSSEGLFLPDEAAPGLEWRAEVVYESPISKMYIQTRAAALRRESLEVPAGRFETLEIRVHTTSRVEMLGELSGIAPIEATQEERQHFALGVGLVLVTCQAGAGYRSSKVLTDFQVS